MALIENFNGAWPVRQDITVLPADSIRATFEPLPNWRGWFLRANCKFHETWFGKCEWNVERKSLRLGWTIYEEVGIVIINDYAIAKVEICENKLPSIKSIIR